MNALRPSAKVGIVLLGFVVAVLIGWVAVELRDHFSQVPAVEKAGGMYGFGSLLLGLAVSGLAALVPLALGLYWLRPVTRFWSTIAGLAIGWAVTGFVAVVINHWAVGPMGGWTFVATMRFGLMPLSALALVTCALFAPQPRQRWVLAGAAAVDGLSFTAVVLLALTRH